MLLVLISILLTILIKKEFPVSLVEQSKAISYFVTLAGIVTIFSWYKRTATPVEIDVTDIPQENIDKQKKVLRYMLFINIVNAVMLALSTEKSIQFMCGISLLTVIISPFLFRTMQEKDSQPEPPVEVEEKRDSSK